MPEWDRSHDWVLQRFWHDRTTVTIRCRRVPPSVADLAALRRCLPRFRHIPPADVLAAVGPEGVLALGDWPSTMAREIIEAAQAEGLSVVAQSAASVSYLPFDRTTGCAWLIEDAAEAEAVAQSMLAEGVPVQEVEA